MSLQQAVGNFRIASKINCGVVSPAEVCIKTDSTCCWCHAVYLYSLHLLLWSLSPGGNPTKNKTGKNTVWYRITPETKNIQPASRTTSFSLDWYDGMAFLLLLFFLLCLLLLSYEQSTIYPPLDGSKHTGWNRLLNPLTWLWLNRPTHHCQHWLWHLQNK